MPICKKINSTRSTICSGDMNHLITIVNRTILPPPIGEVDPQTVFTTLLQPWAIVKSISLTGGAPRRFDYINIEDRPTHEIYIFFDADIWPLDSDNVFVTLEDGRKFRIVGVDDMDEQHLTIQMLVTERGVGSLAGSYA